MIARGLVPPGAVGWDPRRVSAGRRGARLAGVRRQAVDVKLSVR